MASDAMKQEVENSIQPFIEADKNLQNMRNLGGGNMRHRQRHGTKLRHKKQVVATRHNLDRRALFSA